MQDPGSVRVNQDHGSLASRVGSRVTSLPGRVGSRVSVADPVPSLLWIAYRNCLSDTEIQQMCRSQIFSSTITVVLSCYS